MKVIIFILLVIGVFCSAQHGKEKNTCDRLQILFNGIFLEKIYVVKVGDDMKGNTYLSANEVVPEGKIFITPNDTIITYNEEKNPSQKTESDYLKFDFIDFNEDTSFVKLSIFFSSKKGAMLTSRMEYSFVNDSCKWNLEKLSYIEY